MKSIAILGIGSIGGLVAAHIAHFTDEKLFLLARSNYSQLSEYGLYLHGASDASEFHVPKERIITVRQIDEIPPCDIIIICVQTSQNSELLGQLHKICLPTSLVISLQNGLMFEEEIRQALPSGTSLYSGTCWIKASVLSPGHVRHDFGTLIKLGEYTETNSDKIDDALDIFKKAMLTVEMSKDVTEIQITKLALNVPFFTISAHVGKSTSEIINDETLEKQRSELQNEIIKVSNILGITIDVPFIEKVLSNLRKMEPAPPASREDLINRMRDELPSSAGTLLEFFSKKGYDLPQLRMIYEEIYPITRVACRF